MPKAETAKIKNKRCIVCNKSLAKVCYRDYQRLKQELEEEKNYTAVLEDVLTKIREGLRTFWNPLERTGGRND